LAEQCGSDTTPGGVFITRGVGSIIGAVASAKVYQVKKECRESDHSRM
jgi:hypothetical protein